MSPAKQGRKIAIVGATGSVGTPTLEALIAQGIHTITVITRPDSTSKIPDVGVARVERGVASDADFAVRALKGQDVLLLQLGIPAMGDQKLWIEAAAEAGVPLVVPTEFGSDPDPESRIVKDSPIVAGKKPVRDLINDRGMAWSAVVNNPWFDWSLPNGFWGFDIAARTARLYDGGRTRFVTTNVGTVGKATAGLLSLPDAELARFHDKPVFLKSFYITQRDILAALLKATGTEEKDWKIEEVDADEFIEQADKAGEFGHISAFYAMHMSEGRGGDYNHKVGDTMELLGAVEKETLDETVARVVKGI
ncbi:uncharacterized protein PpBr36_10551 [Pyricularia pennisetigena]|uniref:uncharacterized protein n=1 Tax=Pyricularia pennisetigena TaxID=1578925 RepID=UPI00114EE499|nr:uncharacterized protein PpBr36_10551 [Pyricularia pennisetigena]TLS21172.1 hypothetical protein PpBr36_10551 [Pyricularia pennisetigena]